MIANRDIYADKDGNLTDDPTKFASQVAVRGCFLDERIAKRFGIADTLVSADEPRAVRRVRSMPDPEPAETPAPEPAEAAEAAVDDEAASPEEQPKTEANTKPAAKKGAQKTK